jgi:NDP-mannose synthase
MPPAIWFADIPVNCQRVFRYKIAGGTMKAVIQCGGKGLRLRPYTTILPKPLMPVGSKPVLELLLRWLRRNGMREVYITTGYLGPLIRSFCGDGRQWDMRITYTEEHEPLGTLGGLSLLRDQLDNSTFLVLNGDVLTDLNISGFLATHREHSGPLTIATVRRSVRSDFGVIEQSCGRVIGFREKPNLHHLVRWTGSIYCSLGRMTERGYRCSHPLLFRARTTSDSGVHTDLRLGR